MPRSFYEKADPCQEFSALYMIFSFLPFSQAAFYERSLLQLGVFDS